VRLGLLVLLAAPVAAAAQTQLELTSRAAAELNAANTRMTAVYDRLVAKYGPDSRKRLQEAQDAWTIYRDKQCSFETKLTEGGSIHGMVVASCLKGLTEQRTAELARQENCREGDLSCVQR
jgi:uncharacterized protein YecT (DUF1311 family)